MIEHTIFEDLQTKIDEEAAVRDVSQSIHCLLTRLSRKKEKKLHLLTLLSFVGAP